VRGGRAPQLRSAGKVPAKVAPRPDRGAWLHTRTFACRLGQATMAPEAPLYSKML
jgi:hypothetical protein